MQNEKQKKETLKNSAETTLLTPSEELQAYRIKEKIEKNILAQNVLFISIFMLFFSIAGTTYVQGYVKNFISELFKEKIENSFDEIQKKYARKESEINKSISKFETTEDYLSDLTHRLRDIEETNKHYSKEIKRFNDQFSGLNQEAWTEIREIESKLRLLKDTIAQAEKRLTDGRISSDLQLKTSLRDVRFLIDDSISDEQISREDYLEHGEYRVSIMRTEGNKIQEKQSRIIGAYIAGLGFPVSYFTCKPSEERFKRFGPCPGEGNKHADSVYLEYYNHKNIEPVAKKLTSLLRRHIFTSPIKYIGSSAGYDASEISIIFN